MSIYYRIRALAPANSEGEQEVLFYEICDSYDDIISKFNAICNNREATTNIREEFKIRYFDVYIESLEEKSTQWMPVMKDIVFTR